MKRPSIPLLSLFSHWRDQHLLELEAAIGHLANHSEPDLGQLDKERVVVTLFEVDDQGKPRISRRDMDLAGLLRRHVGLKSQGTTRVTPILRMLRLERERRLRDLLYQARERLGQLLDPLELRRLRALPMLAGSGGAVARLLHKASAHAGTDAGDFPATALARGLSTAASQRVLTELHLCLGWPSSSLATKLQVQDLALLTLALPWALDPDADSHGFDFFAPALTGAATGEVLAALQKHLMPKLRGCPSSCFGLVRYLLADSAPPILNLLGLPRDLAWTTSVTWVSLCHGVNLAETIAPGSSCLLDVSEALALPTRISEHSPRTATAKALAATLAAPLAQWNMGWQRVARLPAQQSPLRALDRFLQHLDALEYAHTALSGPMPKRMDMVMAELDKRAIAPQLRFVDPTQRVRQSLFAHAGVPALDAFASGLAAGPNPVLVPALILGHDGRLHEPACNFTDIPNLAADFEKAFDTWQRGIGVAISTLIQRLLGDLPLADQLRLEEHSVVPCQLAQRSASGETVTAPYGFVFYLETLEDAWYYELIPSAGWCRLHRDKERRLPKPTQAGQAHQLPFDAAAFIKGSLPNPDAGCHGWLTPSPAIPAVADPAFSQFRNSRLLARHCATAVTASVEAWRDEARGTLPSEPAKRVPEALKALVPFWSAGEAIYQGLEEDRPWLVVLGLFGLAADVLTLGVYGRISALGFRFVTLALRQGPRTASRLLTPRLRGVTRDALDTLLPAAASGQPETPGMSMMVPLRRAHGAILIQASRRVLTVANARRSFPGPALVPLHRPALHLERLANDVPVAVVADGVQAGRLISPRLADYKTLLAYGPTLDLVDDAGRLGRLPLELAVVSLDGALYVVDPAPSLPKRWIRWGDETWLECSGRYYRLKPGNTEQPPMFEQAPAPYARPPLKRPACRGRRVLPPLACAGASLWKTQDYADLSPDQAVPEGAVPWFDQRKIVADSQGRFVDGRRLFQGFPGAERTVEHLGWARYRSQVRARIVTGNSLFKRIEVLDGLIAEVPDRRFLSAVALQAEDGQRHLVTCVDDGIYYHGVIAPGEEPMLLNKLSESVNAETEAPTPEEELKYLFNGCWDANLHIRRRGAAVVEQQLRQIEAAMAADGVNVEQLMTRRFRLQTSPAQAALFAQYPRRSFAQQTRQFVASDYTYPLTDETPSAVRERIASHLNRLTDTPGALDAQTVLDPTAISGLPPKGRNIAFLAVSYEDGRPEEVYYSVSGAAQRRTDLPLAKRLQARVRATPPGTEAHAWVAEDGTRYINCRGEGGQPGEEALLHLPDLSRPDSLNSGDINDRRLDSERNILAYLQRQPLATGEIAEATLFTRFPTCDSCTSLISQYRQHFLQGRLRVYEGPRPGPSARGSGAGAGS